MDKPKRIRPVSSCEVCRGYGTVRSVLTDEVAPCPRNCEAGREVRAQMRAEAGEALDAHASPHAIR